MEESIDTINSSDWKIDYYTHEVITFEIMMKVLTDLKSSDDQHWSCRGWTVLVIKNLEFIEYNFSY